MIQDSRQQPSRAWIEQVRQRYPVEPALDRAFTRKMVSRSEGGNYRQYSLAQTGQQLEACIGQLFDGEVSIQGLRPLSGGASQEQYYFEVHQHCDGDRKVHRLVLRREPNEAICAANRLREFQLMRSASAVAPVPFPHLVDEEGQVFGRPSMICEFASGVQKPSSGSGNVSGIGIYFSPELRARLAPQFIEHLAAIHTLDLSRATLHAFEQPALGGTNGTELLINSLARLWSEDRLEAVPLLSVAEHWLRRNMPVLDHVSMVHGDYRSGNFLFDEGRGEITAILDWELGYLGDRHADLAWVLFEPFGSRGEQGELLCCGLLEREAFIAAYERASGLSVDPFRLKYFTVLNLWKAIIFSLGSGPRAANGGKTHQDIVLTWLAGIAYPLLESMRRILSEEYSHGA